MKSSKKAARLVAMANMMDIGPKPWWDTDQRSLSLLIAFLIESRCWTSLESYIPQDLSQSHKQCLKCIIEDPRILWRIEAALWCITLQTECFILSLSRSTGPPLCRGAHIQLWREALQAWEWFCGAHGEVHEGICRGWTPWGAQGSRWHQDGALSRWICLQDHQRGCFWGRRPCLGCDPSCQRSGEIPRYGPLSFLSNSRLLMLLRGQDIGRMSLECNLMERWSRKKAKRGRRCLLGNRRQSFRSGQHDLPSLFPLTLTLSPCPIMAVGGTFSGWRCWNWSCRGLRAHRLLLPREQSWSPSFPFLFFSSSSFLQYCFPLLVEQLLPLQERLEKDQRTILKPFVSLDTPGKATVQVVILADPVRYLFCFKSPLQLPAKRSFLVLAGRLWNLLCWRGELRRAVKGGSPGWLSAREGHRRGWQRWVPRAKEKDQAVGRRVKKGISFSLILLIQMKGADLFLFFFHLLSCTWIKKSQRIRERRNDK